MSSGKVLLGVLAGAAAGALAGILFAPAKGSKTRKRILKKGEDYSDAVKEKLNDLLEVVTEKFEKVKADVSDYADKKMGKPDEAEKETKTVEN
ncbi:YtxH domain-containing protein [Mariniphaga sediminis]|jgi:gas vesicle protein|uniref:YtxH domain-containing protein n=1 Tax=Mariniphaga sediminis TaxID=1628158 RepID=A0A399CYF3_9BACT|nr:YtxH domain-containing protein [Mariniphaga sediminis]RIH63431.1 YtxH domain-containing protein [Mariniphaga sediminis]